ncbi:SUF system Fe-S cluster assembly regulator [Sphingorhabdus lutea]|uniref:SUF system Fe-S cluster assembly regulator n=1 Tax=Sphingorhabdus lutea TaxID=1913578 RepID=A0A1L3J9Q1_9SPHN|nr:SUF system Fe-S cluster assembly regulator [Sphingorhabdus lutea]APG61813.1 SUF system Fe-S cluster assembly regulator [Sphingorhabdus lutea]
MRLSNMADYAVVLMCAAARHCGGVRVSATDLSDETGLNLPTTQKLVSILAKAGLIKSTRGIGGGILLSRPAAAISLADIIEAVEGPIGMTICCDDHRAACALETNCEVKPHWPIVNAKLRETLGAVSLSILANGGEAISATPYKMVKMNENESMSI